jgi:hypothetical protein
MMLLAAGPSGNSFPSWGISSHRDLIKLLTQSEDQMYKCLPNVR